jgi:hypothetical protein
MGLMDDNVSRRQQIDEGRGMHITTQSRFIESRAREFKTDVIIERGSWFGYLSFHKIGFLSPNPASGPVDMMSSHFDHIHNSIQTPDSISGVGRPGYGVMMMDLLPVRNFLQPELNAIFSFFGVKSLTCGDVVQTGDGDDEQQVRDKVIDRLTDFCRNSLSPNPMVQLFFPRRAISEKGKIGDFRKAFNCITVISMPF